MELDSLVNTSSDNLITEFRKAFTGTYAHVVIYFKIKKIKKKKRN